MYQNSLKLLQDILFMLLLIIAAPILFLFALISHLTEKSKTDKSDHKNNG